MRVHKDSTIHVVFIRFCKDTRSKKMKMRMHTCCKVFSNTCISKEQTTTHKDKLQM